VGRSGSPATVGETRIVRELRIRKRTAARARQVIGERPRSADSSAGKLNLTRSADAVGRLLGATGERTIEKMSAAGRGLPAM
jgi:hypothetical protein